MKHEEYCTRTEAEITLLAAVASRLSPRAPVPGCPGWDMAKLVRHTGTVHRWATAVVSTRSAERIDTRSLDLGLPADPGGYPRWLATGAAPLVTALREAGPDAACWAWGDPPRSGWWARRMLHETTVHRADAQAAAGLPAEIDPVAAADGVGEFLDNARHGARPSARLAELPDGQSIHLHATDDGLGDDGEWLISVAGGGYSWSHGHAKGTVAVRAPAALLLLLAYGRIAPDDSRLAVLGDPSPLASWQAVMTL